jgi:uncharacterized OB-fold protein
MEWTGAGRLRGVIVEVTRVHRAFGESFEPPRPLALVLLSQGGHVVVRADAAMVVGETVEVDQLMQVHSVE